MIDLCSASKWGDNVPQGTKLYQLIPRWANSIGLRKFPLRVVEVLLHAGEDNISRPHNDVGEHRNYLLERWWLQHQVQDEIMDLFLKHSNISMAEPDVLRNVDGSFVLPIQFCVRIGVPCKDYVPFGEKPLPSIVCGAHVQVINCVVN